MTHRFISILVTMAFGLSLVGCPSGNPAAWTTTDIENYLKETAALSEVSLTQKEDGSYSGSGKTAGGTSVTVTVTQDRNAKKLLYTVTDESGKVGGGSITQY